jgi:heme/copper-type cytochrome/quinol oxidase subunit 2
MKKFFVGLVASLLVALPLVVAQPQGASALFSGAKDSACSGIGGTRSGENCSVAGSTSLDTIITNIVNILSIFVGIVAVIMVIFAGFKYITSAGDSNAIAAAKNTLMWAIVGVLVVALAQAIIHFVLHKIGGVA